MPEGALQRTVGENLRRYRVSKGLSQEAFAEVLGYHRTYVGDLERGKRNLSLQSVEHIAAMLKVPALELLTVNGVPNSSP